MRKLTAVIAVGVLVGGLLAGAGAASAATFNYLPGQGGTADPLQLAASGVVIPYQSGPSGGLVALIEVASPVTDNFNLHMIFFNQDCAIGNSVSTSVSENGIIFVDPLQSHGIPLAGQFGLVGIAKSFDGILFEPLEGPIHSRVYEFNPADGKSRVFEPIILDTFEFNSSHNSRRNALIGRGTHIWSPLRTGATFYAPWETATVHTQITFVCPTATVQGSSGAVFGNYDPKVAVPPYTTLDAPGFPVIWPPFKAAARTGDMRGVVYAVGTDEAGDDVDEVRISDFRTTCSCLTSDVGILTLAPGVYSDPRLNPGGSYTEIGAIQISATPVSNQGSVSDNYDDPSDLFPPSAQVGSFTGYRATFTVGSPLNNFFGRLSGSSLESIFEDTSFSHNER